MSPRYFRFPAQFADSNASTKTDLPGAVISNPAPNMVNGKPMNHHRDCGSDNDFNDPGGWNRASYTPDFLAQLGEPLAEKPNDYRQAALYHLQLMYVVDEFITAAEDSRLAVVAVAVVLGWPSARGLTLGDITDQLGCSPSTLTRPIARFKAMAGLGGSAGGVRFVRSGAESNSDKPAAVRDVLENPTQLLQAFPSSLARCSRRFEFVQHLLEFLRIKRHAPKCSKVTQSIKSDSSIYVG